MKHREINFRLRIPQPEIRFRRLVGWLPSRGNVIFTLVIAALLVLAQSAGALPQSRIPNTQSPSTGTIAYQGRLADAAGAPLTGAYNMIFRLYAVATGGTPLWSEQWTGSNGVRVSDGLFNVMLGSLTTLPQSVIAGRNQLFLGITVGTDDEMQPRVQLGSVPFAVQALTVPDGSVTTAKIANGSVTTAKIADGAVTASKLASDMPTGVPRGTIVMWAGPVSSIPAGWALCDGANGTPDLRDRFIVGAGGSYTVAATGGANQVALTLDQLPSHSHSASVSQYGGFRHTFSKADPENGDPKYGRWTAVQKDPMVNLGEHSHTVTIGNTGGGQAHENRPPYYALAFIMKLP